MPPGLANARPLVELNLMPPGKGAVIDWCISLNNFQLSCILRILFFFKFAYLSIIDNFEPKKKKWTQILCLEFSKERLETLSVVQAPTQKYVFLSVICQTYKGWCAILKVRESRFISKRRLWSRKTQGKNSVPSYSLLSVSQFVQQINTTSAVPFI